MANRFEKGMGGAATGYAVGGPVGALVGGLGSFLFGGNDKVPELGEFEFSPEAMRSYNFADINLEQMNPVLYRKLLENDAMLAGMREALASRREGPTANEQRQISDYLNRQGSAMASGGLAGTPMGNAIMADAAARLQAQIQDRAFQEYQAMQAAAANQANANASAWSGAQGQVLDQFNRNRASALAMDQLRNERDLAQYNQDQAALAASNAKWGGMLGAGLNYMGFGKAPLFGQQVDDLYNYGKSLFSSGVPAAPVAPVQSASPGYGMPASMSPGGRGYGMGMFR